MNLTKSQVAQMIDHTNLKADATVEDFRKLCEEARKYGFKSVAINTFPVEICREFLQGSGVLTGSAVAFPLGQMSIESKVFEAQNAIENGAQEFDYVLNVGKVKDQDYDYIEREMQAMVDLARGKGVCCKVIFETCYLSDAEIIELSRIAAKVKPDFIKTSTGFGSGGAKAEHVRLMNENSGPDVEVKASGGIRSLEDLKEMVEAGATRIGTSCGVQIMEEMK